MKFRSNLVLQHTNTCYVLDLMFAPRLVFQNKPICVRQVVGTWGLVMELSGCCLEPVLGPKRLLPGVWSWSQVVGVGDLVVELSGWCLGPGHGGKWLLPGVCSWS